MYGSFVLLALLSDRQGVFILTRHRFPLNVRARQFFFYTVRLLTCQLVYCLSADHLTLATEFPFTNTH